MSKKYYWLKLKEDFFRDKKIKKLRNIAGGDTYTIIYLKMQLLSLKNEGKLYFENVEDSFIEEVALEIDEKIEDVKVCVLYLIKTGLIEVVDESEYVLKQTQECIGSDSESKDRVREFRKRKAIRENIPLLHVQKISNEMLRLADGTAKFIDNKRYGGNAEYVYDLAMCKCEICGESDGKKLLIHHNNGYSNDLEDLYVLCNKCHANVENGNIELTEHKRRSVTCNAPVTNCNTEIDIDIEKEKDIEIDLIENVQNEVQKSDWEDKFEQFWKLYPRKQNKKKVQLWFKNKQPNDALFDTIIKKLKNFIDTVDWQKENGKYIPMPTTWLNGERWNDEIKSGSSNNIFYEIGKEEGLF